jgi:hypothetical protein
MKWANTALAWVWIADNHVASKICKSTRMTWRMMQRQNKKIERKKEKEETEGTGKNGASEQKNQECMQLGSN